MSLMLISNLNNMLEDTTRKLLVQFSMLSMSGSTSASDKMG